MRTFLAVIACAAIASAEAADKDADYAKKRDVVAKKAAPEHATLGKFCVTKKLWETALREFNRALELNPANQDANKGVGKKYENDKWVDDPKAAPKKRNEGSKDEIEKATEEYDKKRKEAGAKLAKDFEALGDWAAKAGLDDKAKEIWREIIDWYDTDDKKARAALGYVQEDGRWVPPEDQKGRAAGAKAVAGGDEGVEVTDESEFEKETGWKLTKRRSKHFFFQGMFPDADMKTLVKTAEGARAAFLEVFSLDADAYPEEIGGLYVKTHDDHLLFLEKCSGMNESDQGRFKNAGGLTSFDPRLSEAFEGGQGMPYLRDVAAHDTIHELFSQHVKGDTNSWLEEGIAYWFTDKLLKSAATHCIDFEASGGGGGGKNWDNVLDWKAYMKDTIKSGLNPDIQEVMTCGLSAMSPTKGVKAWSLVEWMMAKKKTEFFAFLAALNGGAKQEDAIKEAFSVKTYKELDEQWLKYVDENY